MLRRTRTVERLNSKLSKFPLALVFTPAVLCLGRPDDRDALPVDVKLAGAAKRTRQLRHARLLTRV
jgi:hypothetical protein